MPRKAGVGPSGKELTGKQKESKRNKKKELLVVPFFAFLRVTQGGCMHFRPHISSIWLSLVFAFFIAASGLATGVGKLWGGMEDKSAEFAQIKPEVVGRGMEEFSKPQYRVDVLKVGVTVNMAYVEGSPAAGKEILHRRREAIPHHRRAASFAGGPFIYLSEGVSNETFLDALELATEAGVKFSGVLCGRATWQGGVPAFVQGGAKAREEWLQTNGVTNIKNVNKRLAAAVPCCSAASELPLTKAARHKGGGRL